MEEELNVNYLFDVLKKWFLLILLCTLIGLGGAIFYGYSSPIIYESSTTLYVEPQVNSSIVDYEGILTNSKMIKTYKQILKSRKITEKVINNLKLNISYENLLNMTTINTVSDTEMLSISVRSEYYQQAPIIANEIAAVFIEQMKEDMGIENIVVVDEAIENLTPVEPNMIKLSILGLAAGLLVGCAFTFLLDSMDNKIKNHDDVKKYLKIKTIGMIPNYNVITEQKKKLNSINSATNIKILDEPNNIASESIRMLRTNLNFMDLKVINAVSTVPSEGKTEVLTNLALSFALLEKKVILIDCDLRKPKVHKNFGLCRGIGVSDIVLSKNTIDYREAIQTFKKNNVSIDILAAGSKVSNPSELINSKSFANLVDKLKQDYDLVLIDCPPISSMTDGMLVSYLSDGTIYVIESERTDYQVIRSCIDELKANKAFILGAVLTKVNIKSQKKLYGYKYDYYYASYDK